MSNLPRKSFIPLGGTRGKVYKLLMEGLCQAQIARTLRKSKSTISEHVRVLEDEGFIRREKGRGSVKVIGAGVERGQKSNTLDYYLSNENDDTGVTPVSKKRANVRTANVHHLLYDVPIYKSGDYQWIDHETKPYHNTQSLIGKIPCSKGLATVRIIRTYRDSKTLYGSTVKEIKSERLYIYTPAMEMTADEIPHFEEHGRVLCNEIIATLQRKMGWDLGPAIIRTSWLPHMAVEMPYAQGLADKFTIYSPDGKSWLSNSEGACEFEFSDPNQALTFLDAGRAVEELGSRQTITQCQVMELAEDHAQLKARVDEIKEEVDIAKDERDIIVQQLKEEQELNRHILDAFKQNNRTLAELHKSISRNIRDEIQQEIPQESGILSSFHDDTGGMYQ